MNLKLEDWKNGWFGVEVALAPRDVDRLIELLRTIRADPEQHFHLTSDYVGGGGVGDITFFAEPEGTAGNATLSSIALAPGTEVGDGDA